MQTDLVKIAHQLIETANELIKASRTTQSIETMVHKHGPIGEVMFEVDNEIFGGEDSSSPSKFEDRTAKIKNFQYQLDSWTKKLENAKTDGERRKARVMVGTYKGHLSKAMNRPSAGGSKWKSRV
jgi:hypothetical protein